MWWFLLSATVVGFCVYADKHFIVLQFQNPVIYYRYYITFIAKQLYEARFEFLCSCDVKVSSAVGLFGVEEHPVGVYVFRVVSCTF